MREQADRVEEALSRRIAETEEATRRLEDELKAVRMNTFQKYFFNGKCLLFAAIVNKIFSTSI